jgi:hypothetical protein
MNREEKTNADQNSLEHLAGQRSAGFLAEVWDFLTHSKKWWLTPIVVILLMLGALVFLSGTAAAPFIYTLF